jgi:hypothetical protein
MQLKKYFDPTPLGYIQMSLFILIELLLIFDKTFSKFNLFGPLYLYDALLIMLTIISGVYIVKVKIRLTIWPIQLLIGVASIYLIYSYFILDSPLNYTIRQFALIVYIVNIYLVFHAFINSKAHKFNVRFYIVLGMLSLAFQIGFHFYNFVFKENYISTLFGEFHYFSEMGFMALFIFQVYILVYWNSFWKWAILAFFLLLITTLGHQGSTTILFFTILGSYIFIHSGRYQKISIFSIAIIGIGGLFLFLPSYFLDTNTLWRLIYWKITLKDIFVDYYGVLGHGFGVKFTTPEILEAMSSQIDSPWFELRPEEQYLSPMHNSFLTIAYHVGFVFMLLIFLPLKNMFLYLFDRDKLKPTKEKDFLALLLLGMIMWSSFHVVLELPHSSALFWLVYFSTIYEFNQKPKSLA